MVDGGAGTHPIGQGYQDIDQRMGNAGKVGGRECHGREIAYKVNRVNLNLIRLSAISFLSTHARAVVDQGSREKKENMARMKLLAMPA